MKRLTVLLLAALFVCPTAGAQSLADLLKLLGRGNSSAGSEQTTQTDSPALTSRTLLGEWHYSEPASRYDGNDILGSFGIMAVESMMPALYAKAGLTKGSATVTFTAPDIAGGHIGEYSVTGRYTLDESDGSMTVSATVGGVEGVLHGSATLENGVLTLLFDAAEAAAIVDRISERASKSEKFRMMKSLLDSYPGVKMGCRMTR